MEKEKETKKEEDEEREKRWKNRNKKETKEETMQKVGWLVACQQLSGYLMPKSVFLAKAIP